MQGGRKAARCIARLIGFKILVVVVVVVAVVAVAVAVVAVVVVEEISLWTPPS